MAMDKLEWYYNLTAGREWTDDHGNNLHQQASRYLYQIYTFIAMKKKENNLSKEALSFLQKAHERALESKLKCAVKCLIFTVDNKGDKLIHIISLAYLFYSTLFCIYINLFKSLSIHIYLSIYREKLKNKLIQKEECYVKESQQYFCSNEPSSRLGNMKSTDDKSPMDIW